MREIRLYGSEGGGAGRSPYPYRALFIGHPLDVDPGLLSAGVTFFHAHTWPRLSHFTKLTCLMKSSFGNWARR